jgi:hypothetical protein
MGEHEHIQVEERPLARYDNRKISEFFISHCNMSFACVNLCGPTLVTSSSLLFPIDHVDLTLPESSLSCLCPSCVLQYDMLEICSMDACELSLFTHSCPQQGHLVPSCPNKGSSR